MTEQIKPVVFVDPKELAAMKEHLPAKLYAKKTLGNFTITEPLYSAETVQQLQRENADLKTLWEQRGESIEQLRAELAAAKKWLAEAYEQCATLVEQNQENNGGNGKYLSPRIEGNLTGLHFAKDIRAMAAASTAQAYIDSQNEVNKS